MKNIYDKFREWVITLFQKSDMPSQQEHAIMDFVQPVIATEEEVSIPSEEVLEEETENVEKQDTIPISGSDSFGIIEEIHVTGTEKTVEQGGVETTNLQEEIVSKNVPSENHFEKLLSLTVDNIKYYDRMADQVTDPDVKGCLEDFCRKLIESLILSGCTAIDVEEGTFDMTRHRVVPFQMVEDGTPYHKLVRAGVEWDGEVKVMAIVEL